VSEIAITGIGVASPVLNPPGDNLSDLSSPAPGFDPAALLGRGYRYNDRTTQLAILATASALADAGLLGGSAPHGNLTDPGDRFGVVASSNLGNLDTVCRTASVLAAGTVADTIPMDLPNASSNIVASTIAVRFGLCGPNIMICNGASSGLDAVHLAAVAIRSGRARRVAVVGAEPANDVVAHLLNRSAAELFEGAGAVILEPTTAAISRGASPYACLGDYVRRADLGSSVAGALHDRPPPVLWLVCATAISPSAVSGVPRLDIEAALGAASGALGVMQAIACAHRLGTGRTDCAALAALSFGLPGMAGSTVPTTAGSTVLATAGSAEDGVASLLFRPPGAAA
jgi:3-oxoacyl-[acyl-carrier-protein] synthase II